MLPVKNMQAEKWFERALFYVGVLLIWEASYYVGVEVMGFWKSYSFPSPIAVYNSLSGMLADKTLLLAMGASLLRILVGYGLSVVFGLVIGIATLFMGRMGQHASSLMLGFQTLPSICWVPFAILWYGLNQSAILFVIVIGSMFAIAISVESSMRSINPLYVRVAKNVGIGKVALYRDVVFPAALPGILSGLKQGWSFAWRSLMAGEMMTATLGLGQILMMGRDLADINQVVAVIVVIIALGLLVDQSVFGVAEKRLRQKWGVHSTSNELNTGI